MSPPVPELARLRAAVGGRAVSEVTAYEAAPASRTHGGDVLAAVPCGCQVPLSRTEVAAARQVTRRCGCGTRWQLMPLGNELLAALGSLGPLPASGVTVLATRLKTAA